MGPSVDTEKRPDRLVRHVGPVCNHIGEARWLAGNTGAGRPGTPVQGIGSPLILPKEGKRAGCSQMLAPEEYKTPPNMFLRGNKQQINLGPACTYYPCPKRRSQLDLSKVASSDKGIRCDDIEPLMITSSSCSSCCPCPSPAGKYCWQTLSKANLGAAPRFISHFISLKALTSISKPTCPRPGTAGSSCPSTASPRPH